MMAYPRLTPDRSYRPVDTQIESDDLFANVGPDGVIVLQKHPDIWLTGMPVLSGPAKAVETIIRRWAALHQDGVTYFLPKVAAARGQIEGIDALSEYRVFFEQRLAEHLAGQEPA